MTDLKSFLSNDHFAATAGVELLTCGDGCAKARMEITPMHLNGAGTCQGGAIFTLADLTFAAAANSHNQCTLSVSSTINFFRAERSGTLYAEAHEVLNHKRLPYIEVKVTNETGDIVATFTGIGYRKDIPLEQIANK